ncbi:MAG: MFS transporter [Planctomycetota bacterium]
MSSDLLTGRIDLDDPLGANGAHSSRNYRLGIASGAVGGVAQSLLQPELIIAGMVYELTRNPVVFALVPVLNKIGSLAPPLLISSVVEHRPLRRPYFIGATVGSTASLLALIGVMVLLSDRVTGGGLTLFFVVFFVLCIFNGTRFLLFQDMTGRLIRPHRIGGFMGLRTFLGGGVAVVGGLVITQPILQEVPLPFNYIVLTALGAACMLTSTWLWMRCREEPGPVASRRTTPAETLRRGMRWLKEDGNYRCYLGMRMAFRFTFTGMALLIPYGTERLADGRADSTLAILGGLFVAASTLSLLVSALVWGRIADRFGSRVTLIGAGLCQFTAPVLALLAPVLPRAFAFRLPGGWMLDLPLTVFILSLAAFRAGLHGDMIGGQRFLLLNAPTHRRTAYIAFLNTITCPLALLPLAAAAVSGIFPMEGFYVLVALAGAGSTLAAIRMNWRH